MLGANKTGHVSIAGTSATQVLNPQTQIRLGGPNTLVTSTGQILTSPTLQILNQIQVSVNRSTLLKEVFQVYFGTHRSNKNK